MWISEVFGPTFQGEGRNAGRNAIFIRLGMCNLECAWCDTAYTWAYSPGKAAKTESGKQYVAVDELQKLTPSQVVGRAWDCMRSPISGLMSVSTRTSVVITGGEPLMQQGEVATLARMLLESGHYTGVDIETAGTIAPIPRLVEYVNHFTVSPKLSHSGNDPLRALRPEVLEEFAFLAKRERATFKFVLRSNDDYEEVLKFCKDYDMPHEYVYIMPEGTNSEAILDGACKLATRALREGFHMSLRNHVLIWGDERGV